MSSPIRLWLCAAHHPAFLCGGWAWVRELGGQVSGGAGGDRRTTGARMALTGLARSLKDLPALAPASALGEVRLETSSIDLATRAAVLADVADAGRGGTAAPETDLDLWAPVLAAARGWRIVLAYAPAVVADTPLAFTEAWAEVAMNKAKLGGPFASGIPKGNLAKLDLEPRRA